MIYRFMGKQVRRPWLKRYLKRDEILAEIANCDVALRDALVLFNVGYYTSASSILLYLRSIGVGSNSHSERSPRG